MLLVKIMVDTQGLARKRRLQAMNSTVSKYVESYSCEGATIPILSDGIGETYGVSKLEAKVSKKHLFNQSLEVVGGN